VPEEYKEWIIDDAKDVKSADVNGQTGVGFTTDKSKDELITFFKEKLDAAGVTEIALQETDPAWTYAGTTAGAHRSIGRWPDRW
jgi:hypothetical protein